MRRKTHPCPTDDVKRMGLAAIYSIYTFAMTPVESLAAASVLEMCADDADARLMRLLLFRYSNSKMVRSTNVYRASQSAYNPVDCALSCISHSRYPCNISPKSVARRTMFRLNALGGRLEENGVPNTRNRTNIVQLYRSVWRFLLSDRRVSRRMVGAKSRSRASDEWHYVRRSSSHVWPLPRAVIIIVEPHIPRSRKLHIH